MPTVKDTRLRLYTAHYPDWLSNCLTGYKPCRPPCREFRLPVQTGATTSDVPTATQLSTNMLT